MHQHGSSNQPQQNRFSLPIKLVMYASIGIIAYFLVTEHRAHLAGSLPYSLSIIFPILVAMYIHLAHQEERDALAELGEEYTRYAAVTPAFNPWGRRTTPRKLAHSQEAHHDP